MYKTGLTWSIVNNEYPLNKINSISWKLHPWGWKWADHSRSETRRAAVQRTKQFRNTKDEARQQPLPQRPQNKQRKRQMASSIYQLQASAEASSSTATSHTDHSHSSGTKYNACPVERVSGGWVGGWETTWWVRDVWKWQSRQLNLDPFSPWNIISSAQDKT